MQVRIEYCPTCRGLSKEANNLRAALEARPGVAVEMVEGGKAIFRVFVDGVPIFLMEDTKKYPDPKMILRLIDNKGGEARPEGALVLDYRGRACLVCRNAPAELKQVKPGQKAIVFCDIETIVQVKQLAADLGLEIEEKEFRPRERYFKVGLRRPE